MTTKLGRNIGVSVICEICGIGFLARKSRVEQGLSRFCSKECYHVHQKQNFHRKNLGKENAMVVLDKSDGYYRVYWCDADGSQHSTTWARWAWEMNYGPVPDGYVVKFSDGDCNNLSIDNIELESKADWAVRRAQPLIGRKMSDEARKNMSKGGTGKVLSQEHRNKIGLRTRDMWKRGVFDSDEIRNKWSETAKRVHVGMCPSEESRIKMSIAQKARHMDSEKHQEFLDSLVRGEEHHNWRGGVSDESYPPEFSKALRKRIYDRDGGMCRICGLAISTSDGRVHHIDANKNNNTEENLILLCYTCHGDVHAKTKTNDPVILAFRSCLYHGKF